MNKLNFCPRGAWDQKLIITRNMGKFASLACVAQLRRPRTSESEIVSSNPGKWVKKKTEFVINLYGVCLGGRALRGVRGITWKSVRGR